jgi:hypothetical protein
VHEQIIWGGEQPIMIDTMMAKHEGYLGSFNPKLQIGDTQRMFFQPEDVGLFWMTNQECERKCHDIIKPGTKLVKWTKKELIQLLQIKALMQLVRQIKLKKKSRESWYTYRDQGSKKGRRVDRQTEGCVADFI